MTKKLWDLFDALIDVPLKDRTRVLRELCDDEALRVELTQMLEAHDQKGSVLDNPFEPVLKDTNLFKVPKTISKYTLLDHLGSGGMGDVYSGEVEENGFIHKVAIKFASHARYSSHVASSFSREYQALFSLSHPNIERFFEAGVTEEGVPYLVVEYIEGIHIDQYCDQHKLNVKQRLEIFSKVCDAVETAHRSLIVHRDIKPENILVTNEGEPKLLDFGIAKMLNTPQGEQKLTMMSKLFTLSYASPEQVSGGVITTASDVYSLGVLLYKLLSGQLPYKLDENKIVDSTRVITSFNPSLMSHNTDRNALIWKLEPRLEKLLSGDLDLIVRMTLAKDPVRRYQAARDLNRDIQHYLKNKPIDAKADSWLYVTKKFVQRNVLETTLSVTALMLTIGLTIYLFVQSNALRDSLEAIEKEQAKVVQVTTFLKDMFKISDPLQVDAGIIQVKDLLDYSLKQLNEEFSDQPETKATLLETMAIVNSNLSRFEISRNLFERSKLLYQQLDDQPMVIKIDVLIAIEMISLDQNQKALDILVKILDTRSAEMDDDLISQAKLAAGVAHYKLGDYNQSEMEIGQVLSERIGRLDSDSELVADAHLQMGTVYWYKGTLTKANEHYQSAFEMYQNIYGPTHHKTLKSRSSFGVLLYAMGMHQQAIVHMKFVAEYRQQHLGNENVSTADALNRLGVVYFENGQLELAEPPLLEAQEIYKNKLGDNSVKYADVIGNLALIKRHHQQFPEAKRLFEQAYQIYSDVFGEQHRKTASAVNNLGLAYSDLSVFEESLKKFKTAYGFFLAKLGEDNPNLAYSMNNMGRVYMQLGELAESYGWIEKGLSLRKKHLVDDNIATAESLSAFGEVLLLQGKYERAEKNLAQALSIRKQKLGEGDWRLAETAFYYALSLYRVDSNFDVKNLLCNEKILQDKLGLSHHRYQKVSKLFQEITSKQQADIANFKCNEGIVLN